MPALGRDADSNITRMTAVGGKAPILVTLSGADVPVTVPIKAISAATAGVVYVTCNGVAHVPIPMPGFLRIVNVTAVEYANTTATGIVLWPDDVSD